MNPARTEFFDQIAARWDDVSGPEGIERIEQWCSSLPLPADGAILDLGCGTGVSSIALTSSATPTSALRRVIAFDLSLQMLREGQAKRDNSFVGWVCGDAGVLPLADRAVRAVVALHMLPHVENQSCAFAEWRRVLAPGGSLFIAHLSSRERINEIHRSGPDAVKEDCLPPVAILATRIADAGFVVLQTEDSRERYSLHCARL